MDAPLLEDAYPFYYLQRMYDKLYFNRFRRKPIKNENPDFHVHTCMHLNKYVRFVINVKSNLLWSTFQITPCLVICLSKSLFKHKKKKDWNHTFICLAFSVLSGQQTKTKFLHQFDKFPFKFVEYKAWMKSYLEKNIVKQMCWILQQIAQKQSGLQTYDWNEMILPFKSHKHPFEKGPSLELTNF